MYLPYLEIIDFYSVETHFSTPNVFSFLTFDLCISRAAHSPPSTNRIHILNLPTSVELCYHSEGMLPPYPVWFHWILGKVSEFCLWALSNNSLVEAFMSPYLMRPLCLPIWSLSVCKYGGGRTRRMHQKNSSREKWEAVWALWTQCPLCWQAAYSKLSDLFSHMWPCLQAKIDSVTFQ